MGILFDFQGIILESTGAKQGSQRQRCKILHTKIYRPMYEINRDLWHYHTIIFGGVKEAIREKL